MAKVELDLEHQNLGTLFSGIKHDIDELYEIANGLTNTVQALSLGRGKRGIYVRIGLTCTYVLGEYRIENIEPNSYITVDEIPDGFIPAVTMNKIAIVGSVAQLTNSLLMRFDRTSGTVKLVNLANNRIKNTLLLTSPYNYIVSSSAYDAATEDDYVDPDTVNWADLPETSNVATENPEWEETNENSSGN